MNKKQIVTNPNLLSLLRILLVPLFLWVYLRAETLQEHLAAAGILALSGLTDLLDGLIARHYNMITDLGKLLDPAADKLTQASVIVALTLRYPPVIILLVVFAIKEIAMIAGGLFLLKKKTTVVSSKWFGKVSTAVFYLTMFALIAVPNVPPQAVNMTVLVNVCFLTFSFIKYIPVFFQLKDPKKNGDSLSSEK